MTKTTNDAPAIDFEELRKGLPEGPWHHENGLVEDAAGRILASAHLVPILDLIAAIPDMLAHLRAYEVLKGDCAEAFAQNDRLRSLNAEMREALKYIACNTHEYQIQDKARAILSKTETEQP